MNLEEKVQSAKNKACVYEVTDEILQGLAKAGLNEEKILEELKTSWCKAIE